MRADVPLHVFSPTHSTGGASPKCGSGSQTGEGQMHPTHSGWWKACPQLQISLGTAGEGPWIHTLWTINKSPVGGNKTGISEFMSSGMSPRLPTSLSLTWGHACSGHVCSGRQMCYVYCVSQGWSLNWVLATLVQDTLMMQKHRHPASSQLPSQWSPVFHKPQGLPESTWTPCSV